MSKQFFGIYEGTAATVSDPLGKHRIKVRVPQLLGGALSNWAEPIGAVLTPVEQGQRVFVTFIGGNITRPGYFVSNQFV